MNIGKWIGGLLGFVAFGPLGALAGVILGSLFDESAAFMERQYGEADEERQRTGGGGFAPGAGDSAAGQRNGFLFSLLVMASYIIRADGRVMHSEMEYVRQFLRRNFGETAVGEGEQILLRLFEEAKRQDASSPDGFRRTIRDCGAQIAYSLSYGDRLQLLAFLAEIAKSDGNVCPAEIAALYEVAGAMGMADSEVDSMLNLRGDSLDEAYKVLEISPSATDDEVRAAYRRLAVKHHPDKVATCGEDIRRAANEKFQRINEAKERIYKARGMR